MENNSNIRKYKKGECIVFKSTKTHYGGLSNMAAGFPININGTIVRNSEVLYQALRFPHLPELQRKILDIPSPILAKNLSREHHDKSRPDWNGVRYKIMLYCIELKLLNNWDYFSQVLISTKNMPIVEFSENDKVWGAIDKGDYYEGTNALGRLLMLVRDKVYATTSIYPLEIPNIEYLDLLGLNLKKQLITTNQTVQLIYK